MTGSAWWLSGSAVEQLCDLTDPAVERLCLVVERKLERPMAQLMRIRETRYQKNPGYPKPG